MQAMDSPVGHLLAADKNPASHSPIKSPAAASCSSCWESFLRMSSAKGREVIGASCKTQIAVSQQTWNNTTQAPNSPIINNTSMPFRDMGIPRG
jgi:hypothetical protein